MQHIILIRHGRAEAGSWNMDDFDRPLTPEGTEWISRAAALLLQGSRSVATAKRVRIIHSNALRTTQTAEEIAAVLSRAGIAGELENDPELYQADQDHLLKLILSAETGVTMVVGHNPAIGQCAESLSGSPLAMHPGSVVVFSLDTADSESLVGKNHEPELVIHPH
ncbi:SixA phosphatase family protein [Spirochaeta lutea]|uniref:SixA phosphatase family protein n=1 Tax=Spirochaeta lutea TaxID=1480694 RepID=UPI00068F67E3|nr:histidine phosphatase family protein [Spirochaeta lutea]